MLSADLVILLRAQERVAYLDKRELRTRKKDPNSPCATTVAGSNDIGEVKLFAAAKYLEN